MILETIVFSTIAAASFSANWPGCDQKKITTENGLITIYGECANPIICQVLEEHVATDEVDALNSGTLPINIIVSSNSIPGTILLSQLSTGTLPSYVVSSSITATDVTPGTYGSATQSVQIVIGNDGHITSATSRAISGGAEGAGENKIMESFNLWLVIVNLVIGAFFLGRWTKK